MAIQRKRVEGLTTSSERTEHQQRNLRVAEAGAKGQQPDARQAARELGFCNMDSAGAMENNTAFNVLGLNTSLIRPLSSRKLANVRLNALMSHTASDVSKPSFSLRTGIAELSAVPLVASVCSV
jgi:hypothetical protein